MTLDGKPLVIPRFPVIYKDLPPPPQRSRHNGGGMRGGAENLPCSPQGGLITRFKGRQIPGIRLLSDTSNYCPVNGLHADFLMGFWCPGTLIDTIKTSRVRVNFNVNFTHVRGTLRVNMSLISGYHECQMDVCPDLPGLFTLPTLQHDLIRTTFLGFPSRQRDAVCRDVLARRVGFHFRCTLIYLVPWVGGGRD